MSQAIRFVPSSLSRRSAAPHAGPPRVLIFGGSQGAHAINVAMVEAAPQLAAHAGGLAITHQTGERDLELVRDGYRRAGLEARVEPFLFAMDREMKAADLVVCRAGATTLAELTAAGRAVGAGPAADGGRRSPAEERRSAGGGWRGRAPRADADDGRARWPIASSASPRIRRAATHVGRGAAAREAGCGKGDRRSRVRASGAARNARTHATDSLRRHRRHRHERHRRAARQSRLRGERVGREAVDGHRSARAARRAACRSDTTPRTSATPTSSWCRRRSSRAIPKSIEAVRRQIPVIPRAEMLAELMRLRYGIAIAGAHGKTTTTSMVALVLERAGLDPTAVIGGRLSAFGSNARLGRGDYMVVEADESDRSFLKLSPSIAVITNIDREHMESYGSWDDLQQAFVDFANKVPFYGAVIACADDEPVRDVLPAHHAPGHHLRPGDRGRPGVGERDRPWDGARGVRLARGRPLLDAGERRGRSRRRRRGARRAAAAGAGPAQPAERAGGRRRRARSGHPVRHDCGGARGVSGRRTAVPAPRARKTA